VRTLTEQLAEMTDWGIAQWDKVIDEALVQFGPGAKPSPQQKGAMTKLIDRISDDLADRLAKMPGTED